MTKLDRTWESQLSMSRWFAEQGDAGGSKWKWLKKNHFRKPRKNDCFFCQYSIDHGGTVGDKCKTTCRNCPGRLADPRLEMYWCQSRRRSWSTNPKAFYRRMVGLDKKRRQAC